MAGVIEQLAIHTAGGVVTPAAMKTGRRRIIDFLLSPVQKAGGESRRER